MLSLLSADRSCWHVILFSDHVQGGSTAPASGILTCFQDLVQQCFLYLVTIKSSRLSLRLNLLHFWCNLDFFLICTFLYLRSLESLRLLTLCTVTQRNCIKMAVQQNGMAHPILMYVFCKCPSFLNMVRSIIYIYTCAYGISQKQSVVYQPNSMYILIHVLIFFPQGFDEFLSYYSHIIYLRLRLLRFYPRHKIDL